MRATATAFAVAFVVFSCKGKLDVAGKLDLHSRPVQTVDNMFVVQTKNGILEMRMEAELMERYDVDSLSYELFPNGFALFGYNEEGLLETEITSENARHVKFDDGRENWEAFGNVVIKNILKNEVMETDTLYWDRKNERIYTDCYVRMYSPDGFIQGYGMESDQRARNTSIFNTFNNYAIVVKDSTQVIIDSANFIGPMIKK